MAWGPKPKLLAEMSRTVTVGDKIFHLNVRRTSRKRPQRTPYGETLKGKWVESVSTDGSCEEFPDCHWWPYNDFGDRYAQFSCSGWEPETAEFNTVQEVMEAMIFEIKGWPQKETADQILARLGQKG